MNDESAGLPGYNLTLSYLDHAGRELFRITHRVWDGARFFNAKTREAESNRAKQSNDFWYVEVVQ